MPATFIGVWFGLAGGLAVLVAVTSRVRTRRLCRSGVQVWGTAVSGVSDVSDGGRVLVRYALPDGALLERPTTDPLRKSRALLPGQRVLVWYDPADPWESIVFGRDGKLSDGVLLTVGLAMIAAAILLGLS
ncbi:MAG: DUF3592 domain-containing protein [Streptosporangiaceae bacterium]|jgi:hypothetical protein